MTDASKKCGRPKSVLQVTVLDITIRLREKLTLAHGFASQPVPYLLSLVKTETKADFASFCVDLCSL